MASALAAGGAVLLAACSPERIPGSPVDQGDQGIAFVSARAEANGRASSSSTASSGSSFGSGSGGCLFGSGSTSGSSGSTSGSGSCGSASGSRKGDHDGNDDHDRDSHSGGISCSWYGGSSGSGSGSTNTAPPGWKNGKGEAKGRDHWYDKNCRGSDSR